MCARIWKLMVLLTLLGLPNGFVSAASLTVNVDNPSFRKLVIAIPKFSLEAGDESRIAKDLEEKGHEELSYLLTFSGYFNVIAPEAYGDYVDKMVGERRSKSGKSWLDDMSTMDGGEAVQWRSLNIESLTVASIQKVETDTVLLIKTFDVSQRKELLSKRFTGIVDYKDAVRRYADFLLQMYTGKPGLFSSKLAFVGRRNRGDEKQIFISDFDGSNIQQITQGNYPHLSPAWSPDGRYLAYTSFEGGRTDIYVYDSITKSKRKLTTKSGLNSGANWSPDGKYIAFTGADGGDTDIFIVKSTGDGRRVFIKGSGLDVDPKFSPDGKMIAFVSGRFGNPHIFVGQLAQAGDSMRVISDKRLTYAGWYNSTPAWSPDSGKIIFGGYDKDIDRYDIFIMNPDGTQLERLTLKTGDNESPTWAPNGQLIIFQSNRIGQTNTKGKPALFIMNRDGSSQKRLEIPLFEVQTPHWSAPRTFD